MSMITCPTGWIVVPSDSGDGYVPFFVHVREDDIHWKHNTVLKNIINDSVNFPNDSVTHLDPGCSFRIIRNKWAIEIAPDGLVTATTQVSINDKFEFIDDTHTGIRNYIDLPLFLKNDEYFNIQATIAPGNDNLRFAVPYVNKVGAYQTIGDVDIQGHRMFKLSLVSHNHEFADKFALDCRDSTIFITVRGMLPCYEYEHQ